MEADKFVTVRSALVGFMDTAEQLPRPATGFIVGTELRMTQDKGIGVFATEFIPANTQIYEDYGTFKFDHDETLALLQSIPSFTQRRFVVGHMWGEGDDEIGFCTKDVLFINHSREPTVKYYDITTYMGYTSRDILPGEELTEDYRLYQEPQFNRDLLKEYGITLEWL